MIISGEKYNVEKSFPVNCLSLLLSHQRHLFRYHAQAMGLKPKSGNLGLSLAKF